MATQRLNHVQKLAPVDKTFCDLPPSVAEALEREALTTSYSTGAVLFAEPVSSRCSSSDRGHVKLSVCGSDGRNADSAHRRRRLPLGVCRRVSAASMKATAETQEPSEISFLRRPTCSPDASSRRDCLWVTQHISADYAATCREIRDLILPIRPAKKLARLLMGWLDQNTKSRTPPGEAGADS